MKTLEEIIRLSQRQLFSLLEKMYYGNVIACKGKFLLVRGEAPIMLVAHLDTVHHEKVKTICQSDDGNILMSPQGIGGDDRCGVYALVKAYELADKKPWLLFCCDEETGAGGAKAFAEKYLAKKLSQELDHIKCMVELDRRGSHDAVYYDCANDEFEDYISSKGFKTAIGSFSDISLLAPAMAVAAVNLSVGYYNAHTAHEYIDRSHLEAAIVKVGEIVEEAAEDAFPRYGFIEQEYGITVPLNIPKKYAGLYEVLLDYYFPEEIEEYRAQYGNSVLQRLHEYAFGVPYSSTLERTWKGSGADECGWSNSEISQTASDDGRDNRQRKTGQLRQLSARTEQKTDTAGTVDTLFSAMSL